MDIVIISVLTIYGLVYLLLDIKNIKQQLKRNEEQLC